VVGGRYFIVILPALAIGGGWLLSRLRSDRVAAALLVVVLVGLSASVARWYRGAGPEDWRGTAALIESRAERGDGVVFYAPYGRIPFEYYLTPATATTATSAYPPYAWRTHSLDLGTRVAPDPSGVVAAAFPYRRVWLVASHVDERYPSIVRALGERFRVVTVRQLAGITVTLYERS
jgi:hypothetical protein